MARALFVWGGWDGHQPQQCTELIADRVRARGIDCDISDSLAVFDDVDSLKNYSVIVPCWTMGEIAHERVQALEGAVRNGCGLAGWHGGMGDAFRTSTDYQFMVGGQFVAHPGNIIKYTVDVANTRHPITRGLFDAGKRSFRVHSEQYYMHVDPGNRVLATTTFSGKHAPWTEGVKMPVLWTRQHGQGRVAYCSVGHNTTDLGAKPVPELVTRCIIWAAGEL